MRSVTLVTLAALGLTSCWVVPDDAKPDLNLGGEIATMYVHRGMPMNRNGVLQGTMDGSLPTKWGDTVAASVFVNMDLSNDTGDAWFPNGHGGRVSEFDLTGSYAHSFGPVDTLAGIHSYNFPFGESFPNGPRGSTHELFVHAAGEVLGARPEIQFRYDFDQADGVYLRFVLSEDFEIGDDWVITLYGHAAWSSAGESHWNYGIRKSGWADLQGSAIVTYELDDHTVLGANFNASTIMNSTISTWFDQISIPDSNAWVGLFVNWSY